MRNFKWLVIAWTLYTLTFVLQLLLFSSFENSEETTFVWVNLFSGYVVIITLLYFAVIPLHNYLKKYNTRKKIIILSFAGIIFCLVYILLILVALGAFLGKTDLTWYRAEFHSYVQYNFHNILKTYIFLTVLLFALDYFQRENYLVKKQADLNNRLIQAQLENLKSQFQPHFLFNALNSIVAVIDENKDKAQLMLVQLGDILRTAMNNSFNCEHALGAELDFIVKYLSIEKIRFEQQLEYKIEVDDKARKMKIPCLILQPLIENSVKHGFKRNDRTLTIIIKASFEEKTIKILNNGTHLESYSLGLGLTNVKDRLKILGGEKSSFELYQKDEWLINEIKL